MKIVSGTRSPREFTSVEECVEDTIVEVGNHIVLGAPLGLGKPNQLVNAFFRRAVRDPSLRLTILTALSLEKPKPASDLEERFLAPYLARHYGDYCELEYVQALRAGTLPSNALEHPHTPKAIVLQHLLLLELEEQGYLRAA